MNTHKHVFEYGGACEAPGCDVRCPHPVLEQGEHGALCVDCGCLKPMSGSPDFYEIPMGHVLPCLLGHELSLPKEV